MERRTWSASPGSKPGGDHGHLDHLLLEDRHAEGAAEHRSTAGDG
jgi:hypothetical protein